jgi:adenylate cyclase
LPVLAQPAAGSGFFGTGEQSSDGVVRHLQTLAMVQDRIIPSLALELVRVARAADTIMVNVAPLGVFGLTVGGIAVPTGRASEIWLNFSSAAPRALSAIEVLDHGAAAGSLADKIAIVGASAAGLKDVRQTPIGRMPGVYLHARAVDNMLSGSLLWRPPWYKPLEIALMIAAGLVAVVAAGFSDRRVVVAAWLAIAALGFGGSYALFAVGRLLIDPSAAVISATVLVFAILLIGALRHGRASPAIAR